MIASTALIIGCFFGIIYTIVSKGLPALTWEMISKTPEGGFYIGKGGGVLNAIIGSLYIAIGSSLLSLIVSIPIVLYINIYLSKNSWLATTTRLSFDVLFGMPSIVYGAFGFTIMIFFGMKASLLGGILATTLLVIPIMVRTMDEVMLNTPKELLDASYSLGATKFETIGVLLRQTSSGILTAILLAFGRSIGDVASVMFTAGFSDNIPTSLDSAAATLPLSVFFQLSSPYEEVQARAYASALILTIMVLVISISARILSSKLAKHKV
jgi:phosphate transport system permease protein